MRSGILRALMRDESGSAPAEFVMVGAILTVLTLSVLQLGLDLHVRNTVLDAASEGARFGSLAGNTAEDGMVRTRDLITTALGASFADRVSAGYDEYRGHRSVIVTVWAPLPVIGLLGANDGLEVTGHAAVETLDD